MKNIDSYGHVTGKSVFVDDIPESNGTLYASVFTSPIAHGIITKLDISGALLYPDVVAILTARDIPGENQIGGIIADEPLLADKEVHFMGQPVAVIVARDELAGIKAAEAIDITIDEMEVITDPRIAADRGNYLIPPRSFSTGDLDAAWKKCIHIIEGTVESGGQEHLYLETQGAYAVPGEKNKIRIFASTQGPTLVQKLTARVLGLPMNNIEVDVTRLGGGFGGKEDQATAYAAMAALAALNLNRPVKLILPRHDDIRITGKRHPYSSDFRIGLDKEMKIIAYKAEMWQNGGAAADLSPAILERTLFHSTGSYFIPNSKGYSL